MELISFSTGLSPRNLFELLAMLVLLNVPLLLITFLLIAGLRLPAAGRSLTIQGSHWPIINSILLFAGSAIVFILGMLAFMTPWMLVDVWLLLKLLLAVFLSIPGIAIGIIGWRAACIRWNVERDPALRYDLLHHRTLKSARLKLRFLAVNQICLLVICLSIVPVLGLGAFMFWILLMTVLMGVITWYGFQNRVEQLGTRWALVSVFSGGQDVRDELVGWDDFPSRGVRRQMSAISRDMDYGIEWVPALAASTEILDSPDTFLAANASPQALAKSLRQDVQQSLNEFQSELRQSSHKLYEIFLMTLLVAAGVYGFIGIFIIPKLIRIFNDFDIETPWSLQMLISVKGHLLLFAGAMVSSLLATILVLGILHRGFTGEQPWVLGVFGQIFYQLKRPLILRGLAATIQGGRSIEDDLDRLANVEVSTRLANRLRMVAQAIRQGYDWPEALVKYRFLKRHELSLILTAREAGQVAFTLREIAEMQLRQQSRIWNWYAEFVGPIFVIMIGLCGLVLGYGIISSLTAMMRGLS